MACMIRASWEPSTRCCAKTWGTFLPEGEPDAFKAACTERGVTYVKGLAQALTLWLDAHPSPTKPLTAQPVVRVIVANQKGGVGKTFISSGIAQALAEGGRKVLIVDYDPQGHLTPEGRRLPPAARRDRARARTRPGPTAARPRPPHLLRPGPPYLSATTTGCATSRTSTPPSPTARCASAST
ncbi:ParA family protein [Streptomyces sp. NPDC005132]|uniref:ParA family protein n=1 Tax=Streptomyces sp. NPDC005132 TaxID=3154294 RepID=UPI0033B7AB7B